MHLARNETDAEDLVQSMLIAMLERGIDPGDVAPSYPFRVMRNTHVTAKRRERVHQEHTLRLIRPTGDELQEHGLAQAIASLEENQREVITLKHAGGLTLEQIATATDTPLGTVAGIHRRAIAALRERLTHREGTTG